MVEDLSARHGSINGLFDGVDARDVAISDDRIATFHEQGFVAGIPVLTHEQVDILRDCLDEIMEPDHPGHHLFYEFHTNQADDSSRRLFHALGGWRLSPALHDLLWHPAVTVPASQILGGAVRFWHDQLFVKPARHGGVVAWHQDYSYWTRTTPHAHLTCWIALDDTDVSNGCVHYIPGSHRWNLLPTPNIAGEAEAIKEVLTDEQREQFNPVPAMLKKGEAVFHDGLVLHGSYENNSERPRRGVVVNMFRDGVVSDSDDPLLEGVPPVQKGRKIEGQFFPLLYNPNSPGDS